MGKQDKVNNVSRVEGCGDIQLVKDVEIVRMEWNLKCFLFKQRYVSSQQSIFFLGMAVV